MKKTLIRLENDHKPQVLKKTMQLVDLEIAVINTFIHYDTSYLNELDPHAVYSYNYKDEFITELQRKIEKLKKDYPQGLYAKESLCMFCYPGSNAFSFYSKGNDKYVMRYVIAEDEDMYRVQRCGNNPIPDGPDGMPF